MREDPGDSAEFLDRLRGGDAGAFEALVRAYQHRVFGIAFRMLGSAAEAEEAAQEVFVRVHRSIAGFRGDAALSTWLYAITSRICLTRLGAADRRFARESDDALLRLRDEGPDPPAALEREELERTVRQAIAELPDDRRIVVVLRDLEGLTYEEIAAVLEIEVGTVKSRLHRARMDLRARLEKAFP